MAGLGVQNLDNPRRCVRLLVESHGYILHVVHRAMRPLRGSVGATGSPDAAIVPRLRMPFPCFPGTRLACRARKGTMLDGRCQILLTIFVRILSNLYQEALAPPHHLILGALS